MVNPYYSVILTGLYSCPHIRCQCWRGI